MIRSLNEKLNGREGHSGVEGWKHIPRDHNDSLWPMPPRFGIPSEDERFVPTIDLFTSKEPSITDSCVSCAEQTLQDSAWLSKISLDELGIAIENTIHVWMHRHWADSCGLAAARKYGEDDIRSNFLPSYYSSHVNEVFWKIHGWIDDRVVQWAGVRRVNADSILGNAWLGPMEELTDHGPKSYGIQQRMSIDEVLTVPIGIQRDWEIGFLSQSKIIPEVCNKCP
jgi:hypothetical protein